MPIRTYEEENILREVLGRLDSLPESATLQEIEAVETLLESSSSVPLAEAELLSVLDKLRALTHQKRTLVFRRTVGRRLAAARRAAQVTIQDVADRLRLTPAELRLIESGKQTPGFLEAARLAELYDISLDDIVGGSLE